MRFCGSYSGNYYSSRIAKLASCFKCYSCMPVIFCSIKFSSRPQTIRDGIVLSGPHLRVPSPQVRRSYHSSGAATSTQVSSWSYADNPTWDRRRHASNRYYRKAQSYYQKYRFLISHIPKADAQSPNCRLECGGSNNLKRTGRESSVTRGVGSRENLHRSFNLMTRTGRARIAQCSLGSFYRLFQNNPTSSLSPSFISSYRMRGSQVRVTGSTVV